VSGCVHRYAAHVSWSGSTGAGYDAYVRDHDGSSPPASATVALSGDRGVGGDASRMNPEQLLVLAAASCQLLSFLAVAARARLDVVDYRDEAEGTMDEGDPPARIGRIVLRPRIVLAPGPTEDRVRRLCELAHRECYIASSLETEVLVEPEIDFTDG
jgi:organic hydroperoxide reductase OsmC/OhrA